MSERTVMLVLKDQDGMDATIRPITICTELPDEQVIPAIRAASQDFLITPEGTKIWNDNCRNFNFGDFDLHVDNSFCTPHGFSKVESDIEVIEDDFNMELATLDKLPFCELTIGDKTITVTREDVDDIMTGALCGCTYWCTVVTPMNEFLGVYASNQIAAGGSLIFFIIDEPEKVLSPENFKTGLALWAKEADPDVYIADDALNVGMIDAEAADTIVQYALFGELVYA